MDVASYNRRAWDRQVDKGNRWTIPVGPDVVAAARQGDWTIVLTPTKPVPRGWFPDLAGVQILCLASGGGQQAPVRVEQGELMVRHAVPYADHTSLTDEDCRRFIDKDEPLVFGHTLEDQIGRQLDAGFVLTGLYEDQDPQHPLSKFLPAFIGTRAVKTGSPSLGGKFVED